VAKPIEPRDLFATLLRWVKPREQPAGGDDLPQSDLAVNAPPPEPELPKGIAGLDVELGLRRVLGKKSMYVGMLRKFVAGQQGAVDAVLQALDAGDWDTAVRTAHTTKGVCGNIGASGTQALAGDLEQALKDREPREKLDDLAAALRMSLEPLVQSISDWLPKEAQTQQVAVVDEAELEGVCTRLRELCADMDSGAEDLLNEKESLLKSAFPQHFQGIREAIGGFDFDQAIEQLDAGLAARRG
jgi:two-component system sensor histidine kinase/response regulator